MQLFNIGARGESFFRACHDHTANIIITLQLIQRIRNLFDELLAQRVQRFRAIKTNNGHMALARQFNGLKIHMSLAVLSYMRQIILCGLVHVRPQTWQAQPVWHI